MKIRKLEIIGFKSFSDKTTLLFDEGITSVVGPNGCGKSNVVDAIRWVLGEMSSKNLRGGTMTDVIFNGSESRGPLGMAEVSITFSTEGGIDGAPPEYQHFGEVTVTRRLHRDGESEYFINKAACRLRDIHDLFMGTGVGRGAYSIVEQGKIGLIVNSKPTDRRALIEEAAGVTKFRTRKEQTLRKLEHTRQNLLRLSDTVEELAKQKAHLWRQAQKAERYQRYRAEVRELDLWRSSHRYVAQAAAEALARDALASTQERCTAAAAALAVCEAQIEADRADLLGQERDATALAEAAFDLENRIRLAQMQVEQAQRESAEIARRAEDDGREIASLDVKEGLLEDERGRQRSLLDDLAERERAEGTGLSEGEAQMRALEEARAALERALAAARKAQTETQARMSGLEAKRGGLGHRRGELRERLQQNRDEAEAVAGEVAHLDAEGGGLREKLQALRDAHHALGARREALERDMHERREALRALASQAESLRLQTGTRKAKLASLEEIARSYEGCAPGTRALMAMYGGAGEAARAAGILGLVGEMVEAPREYEAALEAALGERLQYVVVDEPERAEDAVQRLRAGGLGRSGFVPAASARAPWEAGKLPAPDAEGVVGRLGDVVTARDEFKAAAHALLGDVVVMQDLPSALRLWRSNGHLARLVTLDGEVVDPRGTVAGGGADPAGASLLVRRRERQELAAQIAADGAALEAAEARRLELRAELEALEAELESVRRGVHAGELEITGGEKDLGRVESEVKRLFARAGALEEGRAAFEASLRACDEEEARLTAEIDAALAALAGQGAEREALEEQETAERTRLTALLTRLTEIKARVAVVQERREHVEETIERLAREGEELRARAEKLRAEIARGETRAAELQETVGATRASLGTLVEESQVRNGELTEARERLEEARGRLAEAEMGARTLRDEERAAGEALSALHMKLREL
jgi:chromosome segregation protein